MAHLQRRESRVSLAVAGGLSVALHVSLLLLILYSGGQQGAGDDPGAPITQVRLLDAPVHRVNPVEFARQTLASLAARLEINPPRITAPVVRLPVADPGDAHAAPTVDAIVESDDAATVPAQSEATIAVPDPSYSALEPLATVVMPSAQAAKLLQRIETVAAKKLAAALRAQVQWNQAGTQYHAELVMEPSTDSFETDRVVAHVKADDGARKLETRILLRRLAFSRFTQIIDFWDPTVQLHDDEVVGRTHINSRFNVLRDAKARPVLLGKVSTAAGSYNLLGARESDVFRQGIETHAARITLSDRMKPLDLASADRHAHIHEFTNDTRIVFFGDGSYWWRDTGSAEFHRREPSSKPVYLIATRGVTLFVQGVVRGQVLVYSPHRIVIEGNLTYAHDPRAAPDSRDYLGLVCEKDIELASPTVTGPGDIDIQAAMFAKRRFAITHFEHARPATLRIYGSLASGTITATEPRYATRIVYDQRFERSRPPGFPLMNRFAAEDWNQIWTVVQSIGGDPQVQTGPIELK
jgi:hypothetical protein